MRLDVIRANALLADLRIPNGGTYFDVFVVDGLGRQVEVSRIEYMFHEVIHAISIGLVPQPRMDIRINDKIHRMPDHGVAEEARTLAAEAHLFSMLDLEFDLKDIELQARDQMVPKKVFQEALISDLTGLLVQDVMAWAMAQRVILEDGS